MLKILLISFFFLIYFCEVQAIQSCAENDVCSNFRGKTPDYQYSANIGSVAINNNAAVMDLTIANGPPLQLKLNALSNGNFRVIIEEPYTSKRYHLEDALDGEPKLYPITISHMTDQSVQISGANDTQAIIKSSPFSIEFYKNNFMEITLVGSRIIFDETSNAFAFKIIFPLALAIYGIHDHTDHLALQNTERAGVDPYRLKNRNADNYETPSTRAIYGAVPVIYGHSTSNTAGIFLNNAAEQWHEIETSDFGSSSYIMVRGGVLDFFTLLGPTPQDLVRQYTNLTGVTSLPQLWTLGYQQSKRSYSQASDIMSVIAELDKSNFPVDAIWVDESNCDGFKYFSWNLDKFPDPLFMQHNLSATNRKLLAYVAPNIKVDDNYDLYRGAFNNNYLMKTADGSIFTGRTWAGDSSFIDFLDPEARKYYGSFYGYSKFPYTTATLAGFANHMNEPATFNDDVENTFPEDVIYPKSGVKNAEIHNIYGLLNAKTSYEGLLNRDPGKRPFLLSRSHFAGSQRFTAIWTGDNTAKWEYLEISIPQCLNANMLGLVFCGSDIGGERGSGDVTDELLQRWYQAGTWIPFFRQSWNDGASREPYTHNTEVQSVIRQTLRERYSHLFVFYTLFFEHYRTGDPIIRPLFYQYPKDVNVVNIDGEFLLGSDILVVPVTKSGIQNMDIYFPGSNDVWLDIHYGQKYNGAQIKNVNVNIANIPVYYRSGSIIPVKSRPRRNTEEMKGDPFTLIINENADLKAEGTLYQDDYESLEYQTNQYNSYCKISYFNGSINIDPIIGNPLFTGHLKLDSVQINSISKIGLETYKRKIYKNTAEGISLKNLELHHKKKITIKLL